MSSLLDWLVQNEPNFRKNRLPSLYSDLAQQKSSNPDGFAANSIAWQAALIRAALAAQLPAEQKIILRTSNELLDALRSPQFGQPTGLGVVIDEGIRNGKFMDINMFTSAEHSIYQKSWVPSPWTAIRWTLRQIGLGNNSYDSSGRLKQGRLVLVEGLEHISRQLTALQARNSQGVTDRIISREIFAQQVAKTEVGAVSAEEIEMLLCFLCRDKEVLTYNSTTVKFKSTSAEHPEPITDEDSTIASTKALISKLESQIMLLDSRVSSLQNAAQSAVQSKNKSAALAALRSKRLAEQTLQQRTESLHQVEQVFSKIEQAVDQVQFMQVMKSSATTLKTLNQKVGGVDKVDAVMDDLREQMVQVDEVGQAMEEPLDVKAEINEAEIADELEALEKEEQTKKEELKAEATMAKLAELENIELAARDKVVKTAEKASPDTLDVELESSSQKLERIRLDDDYQEPAEVDRGQRNAQVVSA